VVKFCFQEQIRRQKEYEKKVRLQIFVREKNKKPSIDASAGRHVLFLEQYNTI
jgi:hypothetical protein